MKDARMPSDAQLELQLSERPRRGHRRARYRRPREARVALMFAAHEDFRSREGRQMTVDELHELLRHVDEPLPWAVYESERKVRKQLRVVREQLRVVCERLRAAVGVESGEAVPAPDVINDEDIPF